MCLVVCSVSSRILTCPVSLLITLYLFPSFLFFLLSSYSSLVVFVLLFLFLFLFQWRLWPFAVS